MKDYCRDCTFWQVVGRREGEDEKYGSCRVRAPVYMPDGPIAGPFFGQWPFTHGGDWCG